MPHDKSERSVNLTRIIYALCFVFLGSFANAECNDPVLFNDLSKETQNALLETSSKHPFAEGLFWQVEKDGVVSHLMGTMHIPDPRLDIQLNILKDPISQAQQMFLELTSEKEQDFQQHILSHPESYLITEGPSLIERLSEEDWATITEMLQRRGIPGFMAAKFQPWYLGLVLSVPVCAMQGLQAGQLGMDRKIEQVARENDIPRHSLDTIPSLLAVLAGAPMEKQFKDLELGISMIGEDAPDGTLAELYFREQPRLMWDYGVHQAHMINPEHGGSIDQVMQEMEESILDERNHQWMTTLAPALTQTPSFVAVGALHLSGEAGLLQLLEKQGFTVTRMPLN